jgi:hypothetical protein
MGGGLVLVSQDQRGTAAEGDAAAFSGAASESILSGLSPSSSVIALVLRSGACSLRSPPEAGGVGTSQSSIGEGGTRPP